MNDEMDLSLPKTWACRSSRARCLLLGCVVDVWVRRLFLNLFLLTLCPHRKESENLDIPLLKSHCLSVSISFFNLQCIYLLDSFKITFCLCVRRQLVWVCSILPCGPWGLNSGCQAWYQVPRFADHPANLSFVLFVLIFVLFWESAFCCVAHIGFELMFILPQPPEWCDHQLKNCFLSYTWKHKDCTWPWYTMWCFSMSIYCV